MFNALLQKQARRGTGSATGTVRGIPAPVGGWNAKDALDAMKPEDAIVLDNIIPDAGKVRLRPGYLEHASAIPDLYVETLMEYAPPSTANRKLFAASPTAIYDVTTGGAVGAAAQSSLSNGRWQWVNFATTGGNFLCMVNGQDNYRTYDTTGGWTDRDAAVTGIDSATFSNIAVHASRLWFSVASSLSVWYLPTAAITGAATELPLGPIFNKGGSVLAIGSWTKDGGDGMDDLLAIITDRGQVAVYSGTDPDDAATWQKIGVFDIAEPLGKRCLIKVGGDIGIVTSRGVALLSQIIQANRSGQQKISITDKISGAFVEAYRTGADLFGWQITEFPSQNIVIVNVPRAERVLAHQYVVNVTTGAWCRFTGIDAGCWCLVGDELYFGGFDGKVYEFGEALSDNGAPINWAIQTAYNKLRSPQVKVVSMARPFLEASAGYRPGIQLKVDYDTSPITIAAPSYIIPGSEWDEVDWDEAEWAAGAVKRAKWQTVVGTGVAFSVCLVGGAQDVSFAFNSVDLMFEPGSFI